MYQIEKQQGEEIGEEDLESHVKNHQLSKIEDADEEGNQEARTEAGKEIGTEDGKEVGTEDGKEVGTVVEREARTEVEQKLIRKTEFLIGQMAQSTGD